METDEKETTPVDAKVEEVGPCKKQMSITIPAEQVSEHIDREYDDIIRTYHFKGFRRGKVPRRLVEKQLGSHILA